MAAPVVPIACRSVTRAEMTLPPVLPRSVNFETRGPSGPCRAARAVTAASTGVGRFAKAEASSAPAVTTGAKAERTDTKAGARGEMFVRNAPKPFAPSSRAGERSLMSWSARSASCLAVEARIFSPGLNASPNALPDLRSSGLAAIRAATPTVSGPMAEASWPITGIGWSAKVMRAAVVPPIRGVYEVSFSSCAPARAASNFFSALFAASRPLEMFLKAGLRKSSTPPWASRSRFWKVRRTSASLFPHSTARPPPVGSMNIFPRSAPISRLAALIRSAAPDHCFLIASVAPPNFSIMPLVRASMA